MITNPKIDTALHILKGAVQRILGASLTTGVYGNKDSEMPEGRLTVEFDRQPTEEEIQEIEKEANNKIKENVEVKVYDMPKHEAEAKYGKAIYDKFPVPAHIKHLKILEIPDWNINCCIGNHTNTTGNVGNITIRKYRFRSSKQQLELLFLLS